MSNYFDKFDGDASGGNYFDQFDAAQPARRKGPTVGDFVKGSGLKLASGFMRAPKTVADLVQTVAPNPITGAASDFFQEGIDAASNLTPKSYQEQLGQEIVGRDDAGNLTFDAPNKAQIVGTVLESLPQIPFILGGAAALKAPLKVAGLSEKAATVGGLGLANAALVAPGQYDESRRETLDLLAEKGTVGEAAEREARERGLAAAGMTAPLSFVTGAAGLGLAQKLGAGKGLVGGAVRGAAVDAPFEAIEEGGQSAIADIAQDRPVDVPQALSGAVLGGVAGGAPGAVVGAIEGSAAAPQPPAAGGAPSEADTPTATASESAASTQTEAGPEASTETPAVQVPEAPITETPEIPEATEPAPAQGRALVVEQDGTLRPSTSAEDAQGEAQALAREPERIAGERLAALAQQPSAGPLTKAVGNNLESTPLAAAMTMRTDANYTAARALPGLPPEKAQQLQAALQAAYGIGAEVLKHPDRDGLMVVPQLTVTPTEATDAAGLDAGSGKRSSAQLPGGGSGDAVPVSIGAAGDAAGGSAGIDLAGGGAPAPVVGGEPQPATSLTGLPEAAAPVAYKSQQQANRARFLAGQRDTHDVVRGPAGFVVVPKPRTASATPKATPEALRAALAERLGGTLVHRLEQRGTLRLAQSHESGAQGFYADGAATIVADHTGPDEVLGVVLHELGEHAGLRDMLGDGYADAVQRFETLRRDGVPADRALAEKAEALAQAEMRQRAAEGLTVDDDVLNAERLGHFIQLVANADRVGAQGRSLRARLIASLKAWVASLNLPDSLKPLQRRVLASLKPGDFVALARRALQQRAAGAPPKPTDQNEAQRQYDAVVARFTNADGTKAPGWMKAPNGLNTKLSERRWVMVRTENFKRWFGDWEHAQAAAADRKESGDRVPGLPAEADAGTTGPARRTWGLDRDTGEPALYFHGTRDDLEAFDLDHPNRKDHGWLGRGVYLTDSYPLARGYAFNKAGAGEPKVLELFAAVQNPYVATLANKQALRFAGPEASAEVTRRARALAHDGVVLRHGDGSVELVAFEPGQVKSADNIGTFAATDQIRYSRGQTLEDSFLHKAGLGTDGRTLAQKLTDSFKTNWQELKAGWEEGLFDKFAPIRRAEKQRGIPLERSGYVSARLSSGSHSVLSAMLLYGQVEWKDGVTQKRAGTRGLLELLEPVRGDLTGFTAWMVAKRAEYLMAQGRERNFTADEIRSVLSAAGEKTATYEKVAADLRDFNSSVLELAKEAGLLTGAQVSAYRRDRYYLPFYRVEDEADPTLPWVKEGLAGQGAGIKKLKGGQQALHDPLENLMSSIGRLTEAALKNHAALRVIQNLPDLAQVVPEGEDKTGAVTVMDKGEKKFYRLGDPALFRALQGMSQPPVGGWIMGPFRKAKSILTIGVTAEPTFILRNFTRDTLMAWSLGKDKWTPIIDSIRGLKSSLRHDEDAQAIMFAGGSFIGSSAFGGDAEARASAIRRAMRAKGLPAKAEDYLAIGPRFWQVYRELGEKVENSNRAAIFRRAREAGKPIIEAAYESKDLMDYSLHGSWRAMQVLADMIPFFNARAQGLYKLGRSMDQRQMYRAGLTMAAASVLLAMVNADDDEYKALTPEDRDLFWHIKLEGTFWRIPKPFEAGILFGTIPERLFFEAWDGKDSDFWQRMWFAATSSFGLLQWPQLLEPAIEAAVNRDFFRQAAIENMGDKGKLPAARHNPQTSDTMVALGQATGLSPKMMEHLWTGYLGTLGGAALSFSDWLTRRGQGQVDATPRLRDIPVLGAFLRESSPLGTRYAREMYALVDEADQAYRTIREYRMQGRIEEAERIAIESERLLAMRPQLNRSREIVSNLRKRMDVIKRSTDIEPATKRRELDRLAGRINEIARVPVEMFRSEAGA
jgi:hypothetical protein